MVNNNKPAAIPKPHILLFLLASIWYSSRKRQTPLLSFGHHALVLTCPPKLHRHTSDRASLVHPRKTNPRLGWLAVPQPANRVFTRREGSSRTLVNLGIKIVRIK